MNKKIIENLVIVIFTIFNLYLIISEDINFYVHPRFILLSLFASIIALVFSSYDLYINYIAFQKKKQQFYISTESFMFLIWFSILILLPASPLTSVTAKQRLDSLNQTYISRKNNSNSYFGIKNPEEIGKLDIDQVSDSNQIENIEKVAASYEGYIKELILKQNKDLSDWVLLSGSLKEQDLSKLGEAEVVGFIYDDDEMDNEYFLVARFVVSGCAVDATPIGIYVNYDWEDEFKVDDWVEVRGDISIQKINGNSYPVALIKPTSIKQIEAPDSPYLY